ncbi:MAG: hypothetical protein COA99_08435 [Moraxellaceae bacterium]|nr:MAG: hypothetical protein COA99_08435 [Moraxellaceae bacterium]
MSLEGVSVKNKITKVLMLSISAIIASGCDVINDIGQGNGYAAKNICSNMFISGQDKKETMKKFVGPEISPLSLIWLVQTDEQAGLVHVADLLTLNKNRSEAVYRPGFGCTIQHELTIEELDAQTPDTLYSVTLSDNETWPFGSAGLAPQSNANIDYQAIDQAIDVGFTPVEEKQTTSIVVAHQGKLIAERYRDSFGPAVPVLGWSMSKSVTSTLVGLLSDQNILDANDSSLFSEWAGTGKSDITISNLLQMAHGLQYDESSRGENADQAKMLYLTPNHSQYMIERPLVEVPGTVFNYSTGATGLLARLVQEAVGGSLSDAYEFYQTQLFHKIDITSAVIEHDTEGYFVGGASVYMSPRDWARMGQLYLQKGTWNGEEILSETWVDYALTPSSTNDIFGASIWLNTEQKRWASLPADAFAFMGHNEQIVLIIPSVELVVVRSGFTFGGSEVSQIETLVASIVQALP